MSHSLFDEAGAAGEPRRVTLVRLSGEIARSLVGIGRIAVEGEVHRPSGRPGGRVWFTLRDRASQLTVTAAAARSRKCRAVHGERVLVTGRLTFANDRGELRLEAEEVVPVGAGAVAAMIEEARRRLRADGLLDRGRRPLPLLPACVGVVCGADAAVRKDIESVVAARFAGYPVVFVEVTVSGAGAAEHIAGAVAALDARPEVEVIVLARGGGDATQLLPFSDEDLCRALCRSTTPVVSAIGHDGDTPLCDEVADARFGTPSIAAAHVVPERAALVDRLDRALAAAADAATRRIGDARRRLDAVDRDGAVAAGVAVAARRLDGAAERLALVAPDRHLASSRARLAGVRAQLDALSPAAVLARGFAVVRAPDGTVVRRAAQVARGDGLVVELAEGRLDAVVTDTER